MVTKERFAEIVNNLGGTKKAAEILGIKPAQVSQYLKGVRNVGAKTEQRLRFLGLLNDSEDNNAGDIRHILVDTTILQRFDILENEIKTLRMKVEYLENRKK